MTSAGMQAWVLCLMGLRSAHAYQEIAPVLEMIHVFSQSYRLASLGVGSSVLYGRFAIGFCRALFIGVAGNFASRHLRHASAVLGARFAPSRLGASSDQRFDPIKGHGWLVASGLRPCLLSDPAAIAQWGDVHD